MRISRPLAGLVSAALIGFIPLATASPASAAEATSANITLSQKSLTYGDPLGLYLDGSINTATGTAYSGAAYLQMLPKGSGTWTNVAVDTSPGYLYFSELKATRNAQYRVVYVGDSRYSPSTSATVTVKVQRKLVIKNPRGTLIKGTVKPSYKRGKVVIQRKVGKKWKAYKSFKANKKGKFSTSHKVFGSRTNYRLILPGNKAFSKTVHTYYTYKY